MTLSHDELVEALRKKCAEREIKGLGKVTIRQFSSRERAEYLEMRASTDHKVRARAQWWLLSHCILDKPQGTRLFATDPEIDQLGDAPADIIDALFNEILKLSDADEEAVERAGESSAETGNYGSESGSPSSSASPSQS